MALLTYITWNPLCVPICTKKRKRISDRRAALKVAYHDLAINSTCNRLNPDTRKNVPKQVYFSILFSLDHDLHGSLRIAPNRLLMCSNVIWLIVLTNTGFLLMIRIFVCFLTGQYVHILPRHATLSSAILLNEREREDVHVCVFGVLKTERESWRAPLSLSLINNINDGRMCLIIVGESGGS